MNTEWVPTRFFGGVSCELRSGHVLLRLTPEEAMMLLNHCCDSGYIPNPSLAGTAGAEDDVAIKQGQHAVTTLTRHADWAARIRNAKAAQR